MSAPDMIGLVIFAATVAIAIWELIQQARRSEKRIATLERQIRELNPGLPPVEGA